MRILEGLVKISVRELVEFVLRQGSINASAIGSSNRAVLGTLAHKKIQKSMDANYEAEVKLVHECEIDQIVYVIEGRADGIIKDLVSVTIDEIKTTTTSLEQIDENYNHLHWAQAKCYAYFYALQNDLQEMQVRLTYYNIDTKEIKHLNRSFFFSELEAFFNGVIQKYHKWIKFYMAWTKVRDRSLKEVAFPFKEYRAGQRALAVSVYKSIQKGERLYASAPTGIGKTISTLFPSLKAIGEGYGTKIFYLTAKTITRTVAEQAAQLLYINGAKIKVVTLTAKDKICFMEKTQCNPEYCPYANGHFDRVDDAVYEIINESDLWSRPVIEELAKKYQVCPFELSLDLSVWADVVICDYNYMFDPTVGLKRFLDHSDFIVLVDEAHNLVDRAREMYSASLSKRQCLQVKKTLGRQFPAISKELNKINEYMLDLRKDYIEVTGSYISKEAPKKLYTILKHFIGAVDKKLQQGQAHTLPSELVDFYFEAFQFNKIYEFFDEHYITYGETNGHEVIIKMYCIDPSAAIEAVTKEAQSVIFFSATLLPIDYYQYMLGGSEDKAIALPSPFKAEHALKMVATDIATRYRVRAQSYNKICEYIDTMVKTKVGHYMVFFPSYKYMLDVYEAMEVYKGNYDIYVQDNNMDEEAREAFLKRFVPNPNRTSVNFCVLGGIFSEGIDLTEDRLIGVMIVGVGLPQIGLERDLIKNYFDELGKDGYHYAYSYPGMNKVLQAIGRLIRTEKDRGIILLMDERFTTPFYQSLFPPELSVKYHIHRKQLPQVTKLIKDFWIETDEG